MHRALWTNAKGPPNSSKRWEDLVLLRPLFLFLPRLLFPAKLALAAFIVTISDPFRWLTAAASTFCWFFSCSSRARSSGNMAANLSASCVFACSTIDHNTKIDNNINQMHIAVTYSSYILICKFDIDLLRYWVGDKHILKLVISTAKTNR